MAALYLPVENTEIAEAVLKRDPAWASPMLWRTLFPHYVGVLPEWLQVRVTEPQSAAG